MVTKKQCRGDCVKRGGAWTFCRFKWGLGKRDGGGVFERGVDTPMHTMYSVSYTIVCRRRLIPSFIVYSPKNI